MMLLLVGCASEGGGENDDGGRKANTVPLEFYIAVPKNDGNTRVGDPGSETGEAVDWDRLTVIVAYKSKTQTDDGYDPEAKKMVYWDTFTRREFESTTPVSHPNSTLQPVFEGGADTGIRTFTMPLPEGVTRVYGVTYSSPDEEANEAYKGHLIDVEDMLGNIATDGNDHNSDILNLTIPNNYATTTGNVATMDVGKFLSVATGYGVNTNPSAAASPYDLTVVKANDIEMRQYWSMTLHRLATKLDIQWDAQGAFSATDKKYVDVYMDGFSYEGGGTDSDVGSGRLFPYRNLLYTGHDFTALGGISSIYNTTPVSKRNGRVYHYIFPDGYVTADPTNITLPAPKINFKLTTTITNPETGNVEQSGRSDFYYSFRQLLPLQPAAWYKINTKIKGNSKTDPEVTVRNEQ